MAFGVACDPAWSRAQITKGAPRPRCVHASRGRATSEGSSTPLGGSVRILPRESLSFVPSGVEGPSLCAAPSTAPLRGCARDERGARFVILINPLGTNGGGPAPWGRSALKTITRTGAATSARLLEG